MLISHLLQNPDAFDEENNWNEENLNQVLLKLEKKRGEYFDSKGGEGLKKI